MMNQTQSAKLKSKATPEEEINELLSRAYELRVKDLKKSIQLAHQALELSRLSSNNSLIAKSLSKLSLFRMITGEYEESMKLGDQALAIFKEINDLQGIADVKYSIAGIYYKTDNYHLGLIYLIDCLEIYRKLDDYHNQARVHKSLGTIYEYFGDEKSAIISYEKAIKAGHKVNDLNLVSNALNPLSGIYLSQGDVEKADEVIEESLRMKKETGDVRGMAFALYGKAKVYAKRGQFDLAEATFFESNKIHEEMGERLGTGMGFHKLGALYLQMGDLERAEKELNKALEFSTEFKIMLIKFKCNYLMYKLYKQRNDAVTALKYLEIYLQEKEAVINTQTQKVIESYEAITTMERLQKEAQMNREKAEILKKKNRAEESSRMKQEFLSTMSHEIRTPLNAVITITSLLVDKFGKEENELISSLKFSSNNLLRIINDILDFSKLEAGKVKLDLQTTDLKGLLSNIQKTYNSMALEKGLELNLHIDPKASQFYEIDETKLSQILGNLISNAIKFTEAGSVDIHVKYLNSNGSRDQLEFRVEDTGGGIAESFLEEIFDSFSQPKSYTTKKHGGSGLGLAIVKKLVELHGSTICVETSIDEGSAFFFEVGFVHGAPVSELKNAQPEELNGLKVLVAEDNSINAMVVKKLLNNWGLETDLAKDGNEAITKCAEKKYDCILMDIHMPNVDGFTATRVIRTGVSENKNTPIYALTADINANQNKQHESYFSGFLLKPIEREKLYMVLKTHKI